MYCRNCGAKLSEGAKFCSKCGTKVQQSSGGKVTKEDVTVAVGKIMQASRQAGGELRQKLEEAYGEKLVQKPDAAGEKQQETKQQETGRADTGAMSADQPDAGWPNAGQTDTGQKNAGQAYADPANTGTAMDMISPLLTTTDFDCIIANNDAMALGAVEAMTAQGLDPTSIPIVGIDATVDGIQAVKDGTLAMTVFQDPNGQGLGAVQAAVNMLEGKAINEGTEYEVDDENANIVWVPFEPVTPDNVADYE